MAGIVSKTVILILEARSKRRALFPAYRLSAPEVLVSLYDRTVLWWLNPLFVMGFRSNISLQSIYPVDSALSSENLEQRFQNVWRKQSKQGNRPLLWALSSFMKMPLIALMIPRLCLSAFKLSQPLLINRITSLLGGQDNERNVDAGRSLIGATVLIYSGLAISNVIYKRQLQRFLTKLRGALVTTLYSKTLVLSSDKLANNSMLTLVTTDVQRINRSLDRLDDLFATPIEIAIAIFLLERQIGVSCVAPVAFSAAISAISFFNSNAAVPLQKRWLAAVQKRIAYTSAVLGCPKGFKMLGLTNYLTEQIQHHRVEELDEYAGYRKFVTWRNVFGGIPQAFAPALTLMMFTLIQGGSALNPTVAFTTLALVALLTSPVQELIFAVPMFQTAVASVDRIQAFLLLDEPNAATKSNETTSATARASSRTHQGNAMELQPFPADRAAAGETLLQITAGEVTVGKEQKHVLRKIELKLNKGSLNMLVGPVGSGKSTLLKAVVGEVELTGGSRWVTEHAGAFAYCAQDPWLPNDTVHNLIVGHSEFDPAFYATVMQACGLYIDIATFSLLDETIIGTKGVSLSGGQRQRLALARALYARKKIMVVDDALSGLDAGTSRHLFEQVFGERGICKTNGLTVLLATHAVQYLQQADSIIALSSEGSISEQGSFRELDTLGGYVHSLKVKAEISGIESSSSSHDAPAEAREPVVAAEDTNVQQDLARRTGDMAVYAYYAKSIGWKYGLITIFTAIGFAFGMKFPDLWVRWWSEDESSGRSEHPLGLWIGIFIFLGLTAVVSVFVHIWVMLVYAVPKSSAKLHQQLLLAVMRAPYSFFVNTDSGITLNRFSNDMSLIELDLAGAVMQTMDGGALCIGSAMLIAAGAEFVGITMPFVILILYILQKYYLRTSRQLRFMDLEAQAPLATHYQETLAGVSTIRAFGWQEQAHQKCLDLLDVSQKAYYMMFCIQRWLNLVLDFLTAAIAVIVVAMAMELRNTSSAGAVGVSLLNILSFNTQLAYLITAWTTMETALGAVARVKNFEKATVSEDKPSETHEPPTAWPQGGALSYSKVRASYNVDGEEVLKGISFDIAAGEKVGICGRSGSGKSSLLLTLLRLLDHSSGSMSLDGIDLTTVPRQIVRERLTALPQEAITVPGSLRDNLDPLKVRSDQESKAALARVGLLENVESQRGLDTSMQDLSLSQGQMQLFAVARALLKKSRLLVLDEMTSSVDTKTEDLMLQIVKEEFAESTVIAVAHRLQTIVDFDKVIVLDKGEIVETGKPSDLLEKENSRFRAMWESSGH